jgi:hypothetical protein
MKPFIFLLILLHGTTGHAIYISVPGSAEGNTANGAPFSFYPPFTMRYQQVYGASAFGDLSEEGGWITAMAFRFEAGSGGGANIPNVQINLSTTPRAVDGLSTVFADNVGLDNTIVLGPGQAPFFNNTPGAPPFFPVMMTFDRAFYYDPKAGNLLLDVWLSEAAPPDFQTRFLDASHVLGDSVSRVYGDTVNSPSGTADTLGLVTAFTVTPVPEPSAWVILLLGLPALVWGVVCRRT